MKDFNTSPELCSLEPFRGEISAESHTYSTGQM